MVRMPNTVYGLLAFCLFLAGPLHAKNHTGGEAITPTTQSRQGHFNFSIGGGITYNIPVRAATQVSGEYYFWENISLGLSFTTWIHHKAFFIFRGFGRYHFDIASLPKFTPYIGLGVGGGFDNQRKRILDLMLPNLGYQYKFSPHFSIGSEVNFHLVKDTTPMRLELEALFVVLHLRF